MTALATWWRRLRTNGRHRDDGEAAAVASYNRAYAEVNARIHEGFNRLGPPPGFDENEEMR